jgi:peptide/nickel transport system ATP-binding protein
VENKILEIRNLKTQFMLEQGVLKAVDGVTFDVYENKTLGVVGESGCGKSVTARSLVQLQGHRGKIVEGDIYFYGDDYKDGEKPLNIAHLDPDSERIRKIRGREISMIFQEPMASMSPVYTVSNQVTEVIRLHQGVEKAEAREIALDMLHKVGIPKPETTIDQYPYQLSGGMCQRVMIAMALSCRPRFLIADEPTTALDVTIQAQILDLIQDLQQDLGMGVMMITHDLGVIAQTADEVAVMYLGKIVEHASAEELFYNPLHPYTQSLLKSIPMVSTRGRKELQSIKGTVPDPFNIPSGCPFHPRCPKRFDKCDHVVPELIEVEPGHKVSCLLYDGAKSE